MRDDRRRRSTVPHPASDERLDASAGRRLDDNLVELSHRGAAVVACAHCGQLLGEGAADGLGLAVYEGPSTDAGPQIVADPADYVDTPVVFRRYCCPGCWTAVHSAVVPAGHRDDLPTAGRLRLTASA